jgi:hypothetical protein
MAFMSGTNLICLVYPVRLVQQNKQDKPMKLPAAAYSTEVATSATKAGSCGVSCGILRPVGQSLWATCRSHYPPSPRLRRVLPAFIPVATYSAEAADAAAKAGSYGYSAKENKTRQAARLSTDGLQTTGLLL